MFDSNLDMRDIHNDTTFADIHYLCNMNDDEHYGFYTTIDVSNTPDIVFIHISRNDTQYIVVNKHSRIKDFFGYTSEVQMNNVKLIIEYNIYMDFDNFNINEDKLIPIERKNLDVDNKDIIIAKDKFNHGTLMFYNVGYKVGSNSYYIVRDQYDIYCFMSYYNTRTLKEALYPNRYTLYKLKDDIGMRFTIRKE